VLLDVQTDGAVLLVEDGPLAARHLRVRVAHRVRDRSAAAPHLFWVKRQAGGASVLVEGKQGS
jgi:hypothetical protein